VKNIVIALVMVLFNIFPAYAADGITRRDGFLLLWQSIHRPAFDVREAPFTDVTEGERGFSEITYAKNRGVLDDEPQFYPDNVLTLGDALLWLYRTRNVVELPDMQKEHMQSLMQRYPIVASGSDVSAKVLSQEELLLLTGKLDGLLRDEVHKVSMYGEEFHGDGTAFGETFDMHAITAAHRSFPHNTLVKVTNIDNEKSVTVRINDRGPYVSGRDMDLSVAAFTMIAPRSQGILRARFERLGDIALAEGCGQRLRFQQRITKNLRFQRGVPHQWQTGKPLILKANRWFVVRGIAYPDGTVVRVQDWVHPDESFTFTPSSPGRYVFQFASSEGRRREMRMNAVDCASDALEQ
jgi:hypothetical protein